MLSNSFTPKITLPTRFSNKHGTLIDNCFCKLSEKSLSSDSGILIKKFSDHQPYFTIFDIKHEIHHPPKFVTVNQNTQNNREKFFEEIRRTDIMTLLNKSETEDPNTNYDILGRILTEAKEKHFKTKTVRYNKYKHKNNVWITKGVLKSIKTCLLYTSPSPRD